VGGKNYEVLYSGGTTATDNSGTLQYVRVEFAGFAPSLNNELNSFTFAAVGSGTRASFLQSMSGLDDAFEFFGGGFDLDHLVAYETGDDMFDMSEGYVGRMQFLIGFNSVQLTPRTGAGSLATDLEGIENDGCNGRGATTVSNQAPFTVPVANFTPAGRCAVVRRTGWRIWNDAPSHGRVLRQWCGDAPAAGVSLRDPESTSVAGIAVPDLRHQIFKLQRCVFAETPENSRRIRRHPHHSALDLTGNALTSSSAASTALFTAIPAVGAVPSGVAAFDWTPVAGSAIAAGGLATFTGKVATKAGTFVTGTSYVGAVGAGGTKWWSGWTTAPRV
jgi:hypothetical protein